MYENGGNTTHRHLDGHPQLFVYPFESQVGTRKISDYLSSFVPQKYRWPQILVGETPEEIYEDIWDEEVKFRIKTPHMSKFKSADIRINDKDRKKIFTKMLKKMPLTRASVIESFFRSTFLAWKNLRKSGKEQYYVGYNPVQILDAERIIEDFPNAKIVHVIRNPFSAYAETKHRPAPLSVERYINTWNITQLSAINISKKYPDNVIIVRFEDLIEDPKKFFTNLCKKLGIDYDPVLLYPSWNGEKLDNMYPWGTIQYPTIKYNKEKIKELSKSEYNEIKVLTSFINEHFNYKGY